MPIETGATLFSPMTVALANARLFSATGRSTLGKVQAVCIDIDACVSSNSSASSLDIAASWAHLAQASGKRVVIVGEAKNLVRASQFRGRDYRLLDRRELLTGSQNAKGEALANAVEDYYASYYAAFDKTDDGFIAVAATSDSSPHASTGFSKEEASRIFKEELHEPSLAEPMTEEQLKHFNEHMHRP